MSVCLYVFVICIYLSLGETPTSQILVENTVRVERSKLELTFGAPRTSCKSRATGAFRPLSYFFAEIADDS